MSLQNRTPPTGWIEIQYRADKLPEVTNYDDLKGDHYKQIGSAMSLAEVDSINDITDMFYHNWEDIGAPRQIRRLDIISVRAKGYHTCGYLVIDPKRDTGIINQPNVPYGLARKYYGDEVCPLFLWIIPVPWFMFSATGKPK